MPRPPFTTKLSLPARFKHSNTTGSPSNPTSTPTNRQISPKRNMEQAKPGLMLRANVLKVRGARSAFPAGESWS
jgi:phosphatidylserine decarboxylase